MRLDWTKDPEAVGWVIDLRRGRGGGRLAARGTYPHPLPESRRPERDGGAAGARADRRPAGDVGAARQARQCGTGVLPPAVAVPGRALTRRRACRAGALFAVPGGVRLVDW